MTAPLLPCPFCGKTPAINDGFKTGHFNYVEISCSHPVSDGPDGFDDGASEATVRADTEEMAVAAWNRRAYLAASPSPSMEMEVGATAWEGYWPGAGSISSTTKLTKDKDTAARWQDDGAEIDPLVTLSQAQSALAAMRAERDEAWNNGYAARDGVVDACRAQVLHLTEENEALRKALEPFAKVAAAMQGNTSTKPDDWTAWGYNDADLLYGDFRLARTTLKENAL